MKIDKKLLNLIGSIDLFSEKKANLAKTKEPLMVNRNLNKKLVKQLESIIRQAKAIEIELDKPMV